MRSLNQKSLTDLLRVTWLFGTVKRRNTAESIYICKNNLFRTVARGKKRPQYRTRLDSGTAWAKGIYLAKEQGGSQWMENY